MHSINLPEPLEIKKKQKKSKKAIIITTFEVFQAVHSTVHFNFPFLVGTVGIQFSTSGVAATRSSAFSSSASCGPPALNIAASVDSGTLIGRISRHPSHRSTCTRTLARADSAVPAAPRTTAFSLLENVARRVCARWMLRPLSIPLGRKACCPDSRQAAAGGPSAPPASRCAGANTWSGGRWPATTGRYSVIPETWGVYGSAFFFFFFFFFFAEREEEQKKK
jgi:hypothetical protein